MVLLLLLLHLLLLLRPQQWQSPQVGVWRGSGQAHLLDLVHGCGWGVCYSKKRCCKGASTLDVAGSCVGEADGGGVGLQVLSENWVLAG